MFKKILGTAGSKILIAGISLLVVFFNARYLGAEGVGTIGLIVLGITIILLVTNFIGGTALVYLSSRVDNFKLLLISYLWAFLVALFFWVLMRFVDFVPKGYASHVVALSLAYALASVHFYLLLGHEKIRWYNFLTTFQYFIQLAVILYLFLYKRECTIHSFLLSLYFSYFFVFIVSGLLMVSTLKRAANEGLFGVFKQVFRLGAQIQTAFLIQMMNYRMGYYLLDYYVGRSGLGMFHFGNQLAEGTWILGKSVSIVQYSRISNIDDREYARRLTLRLMKLTFLLTFLMILVLLLLPAQVFDFFGKDFSHTRMIIACLSVGILANAMSMMFSHYFAGLGKPRINLAGSLTGLLFTVALGFWLIPVYGLIGAGVTASVSYLASLVYQFVLFVRMARPDWKEFLLTRDDIHLVTNEIRLFLKRKDEALPETNYPDL